MDSVNYWFNIIKMFQRIAVKVMNS